MARIPPGSECGLRPGRDSRLEAFRNRFSRIGPIGPIGRIGKKPGKDSKPGARSCVSQALALAEPTASISCRFLQILLVLVLVDYSIDLRTFQFSPVKHCLPLSRDSVHAPVLNPRCLTEYFPQNLMDLACFCSKSQDKTTTNPQFCNFYKIASKNRRHSNRRPNALRTRNRGQSPSVGERLSGSNQSPNAASYGGLVNSLAVGYGLNEIACLQLIM
jgi:hypothetical protein